MKKIICLILSVLMLFSLTACGEQKGDGKVQIKYYAEASDLIPALKNGAETIGLLPEPAVSNLLKMSKDYSIKLDIQQVYGGGYPQAVIVAKKSVIESDGAFINEIVTGISQGASWMLMDNHNAVDAVKKVNNHLYEIEPSLNQNTITSDIVRRCNISYESATTAKASVIEYLQALISVEESATVIPSDAFFYDGTSETEDLDGSYLVVAPDGAPALALARLIYLQEQSISQSREVEYRIVSATTIASYVKNTEEGKLGDIVILPVNAAAKLIGNGEKYQMVGVATHGNLYIVSNQGSISSLKDLQNKRIGVFGQGNVPDLTLRYLLNSNGIEYKQAD